MSIIMPSTPGLVSCSFYLETNSQVFTSPVSKATKRQELQGARWMGNYTLPSMDKYQGARWRAFFLALKGMTNTFDVYDPDQPEPLGPAGGTPLVDGASQTGILLNVKGCTPNALFLMAGDYFSWTGGELKMLKSDAVADGSGDVTLSFEPAIRYSPADEAALITTRPTCTMILSSDTEGQFNRNRNGIYDSKSFSAYEVFT